jgi:hypothetical protein
MALHRHGETISTMRAEPTGKDTAVKFAYSATHPDNAI